MPHHKFAIAAIHATAQESAQLSSKIKETWAAASLYNGVVLQSNHDSYLQKMVIEQYSNLNDTFMPFEYQNFN